MSLSFLRSTDLSSGGSVAKDLLPEGFTHPGSPNGEFTKETDIMDVWFDLFIMEWCSGQPALELTYPADLYLEGSD